MPHEEETPDLEIGGSASLKSTLSSVRRTKGGKHLRWCRIAKEVEVKDATRFVRARFYSVPCIGSSVRFTDNCRIVASSAAALQRPVQAPFQESPRRKDSPISRLFSMESPAALLQVKS